MAGRETSTEKQQIVSIAILAIAARIVTLIMLSCYLVKRLAAWKQKAHPHWANA